jgi:hypothetical protein
VQDDAHVLGVLTDFYLELHDLDAAREAGHAMLELSGLDKHTKAAAHRKLAAVETQAGNDHQAQWEREQADALSGD